MTKSFHNKTRRKNEWVQRHQQKGCVQADVHEGEDVHRVYQWIYMGSIRFIPEVTKES